MSDVDYSSYFLESWTSPESRKRKKGLKKRKKDKNSLKNQDVCQKKKKKKNVENKESKEVSQRKKKKKKRPILELNDGAGGQIEYWPKAKSAEIQKHQSKEANLDHLTQDSTKKGKRKLKVAFNLPTACAKHSKESTPEASQAAHDYQQDYSPCNSDDLNSQDLFITQKMFRPSPPESSSGEASEKGLTASPQQCEDTQENNEVAKTPPCVSPNRSKSLHKCVQATGKKLTLLSKRQFKCSLTKARKPSRPQHVKPQVTNVFLSEPIVVNSSPDVANNNKSTSIQCPSLHANAPQLATTWTQTENFFTTELSSYLSICQKTKSTSSLEELRPLDLSLPHRERKNLGSCFIPEVRHQALTQIEENKSASNSWSSDLGHEVEVGKETLDGAKTMLSTELRFEAKCGDTTTSSEENENSNRFYKLDLTQVRAVQMRLNESFFFKTKGEPQSPRPDSPLMKLSQGRKVKGRKKH
ncbi:uncharacterized protein LOC114465966 [Gouania willdenowi]|uniref:uncharacterized protein LOC114465966 n=1 Tax=Gouania willdenowi TaxID=441366 RepID=UPI0010547F19|nr:uncharacterized protein LOC114465966 [Gouania willdenowi]